MKIDEFGKDQEVEEGFQDVSNAIIGKRATSAIKGMFTGNKDQRIQDEFVSDFLTSIGPRLKQSISAGLVRLPPAKMPTAAPDTAPIPDTAPAVAPKNAPSNKKRPATAAAPTPRKDAGGRVPYDDLAETHFYKYDKLNALFESIIEADEPDETTNTPPPTNAQSISAFLSSWFTKYMQGYDWTPYKPQFDALFKEVENTYRQTGGKDALTKLAKAAYSITGATGGSTKPIAGTADTKKQDEVGKQVGGSQVGGSQVGGYSQAIGGQAPMSASFVQAHLDALKTSDPKGYAAIVKKIIAEYKKAFVASNTKKKTAAPAPAPAPTSAPVTKTIPPALIAESRSRRYPKL